jgi:hypothetical protein
MLGFWVQSRCRLEEEIKVMAKSGILSTVMACPRKVKPDL